MAAQKSVLITGCSTGGIGHALARSFHAQGLKVIATGRSVKKLEGLDELGIVVVQLDVTDPSSIEKAVKEIGEITQRKLDILVNNAGIGYQLPILDADLEVSKGVFETNFFGRIAVTKAFSPFLIASKGTIINIGSISGFNPTPWSAIYNSCCAAIHMWSDILRLEMSPFGVKVILVVTGAVKSNFHNNTTTKELPPGSLYLPEKEVIEATMAGAAAGNSHLDTLVYAQRVVDNALRKAPRKHQWAGTLSTKIWLASTFLWATAWDYIIPDPFGITALRKKMTSG